MAIKRKFQIRFIRKGSGSYEYFEADRNFQGMAVKKANEYLQRKGDQRNFMGFSTFRPLKTVEVVEYDGDNQRAVPKGIRFKLELAFFEATYTSGRKERSEWYRLKQKV